MAAVTSEGITVESRAGRKALLKLERERRHALQAEHKSAAVDIGTVLTAARLRPSTIEQLIDGKRFGDRLYQCGGVELMAADEIVMAITALTSRLRIKPVSLERVDGGRGDLPWPARVAGPVARYQRFADYWSARARGGDPTLAILWATLVDGWLLRVVAYREGVGPERALRAILGGLRAYAVLAGFVTGALAAEWMAEAERVFPVQHPDLRMAEVRAGA